MDNQFNTLAQSAVNKTIKSAKILNGYGSDAMDKELTNNRSKRKLITQSIAIKLIEHAKGLGDEESVRKYRNIYYCQSRVTLNEGRTHGNYCGNRLCTVCTANRKAELIRKYLPIISTWEDPYFVTLTSKACKSHQLSKRVDDVLRAYQIVKNRIRDKYRRNKCEKLVGVRSLECNFNPRKKTYNPHLHLIIRGKEMAELFRVEWQKLWTSDYANMRAQHKRSVKTERLDDMVETIKYSTKVFTELDKNKKGE